VNRTTLELASVYRPFPELKQNLGCNIFNDDCKVETVVTRWPMAQDMSY
jgi:hypothetical protein